MRIKAKIVTFALSAMVLAGCGGGGGGNSEYTVSFDTDGGSAVSAQKVKRGEKASRPSAPTKDGYTFDNWYADKYKKVEFDFDMAITADWTVYANWTPGGAPSHSSEPSGSDSTPATPSESTPTGGTKTVYFKDASWWSKDGARTSVYLWKGADKNADWPGQVMTKDGGVWKFDIDTTLYENLIFARYAANDSDQNKDWGAKSVEISIASIDWSKPLYDISGTSESWGDPGVQGTWKALLA